MGGESIMVLEKYLIEHAKFDDDAIFTPNEVPLDDDDPVADPGISSPKQIRCNVFGKRGRNFNLWTLEKKLALAWFFVRVFVNIYCIFGKYGHRPVPNSAVEWNYTTLFVIYGEFIGLFIIFGIIFLTYPCGFSLDFCDCRTFEDGSNALEWLQSMRVEPKLLKQQVYWTRHLASFSFFQILPGMQQVKTIIREIEDLGSNPFRGTDLEKEVNGKNKVSTKAVVMRGCLASFKIVWCFSLLLIAPIITILKIRESVFLMDTGAWGSFDDWIILFGILNQVAGVIYDPMWGTSRMQSLKDFLFAGSDSRMQQQEALAQYKFDLWLYDTILELYPIGGRWWLIVHDEKDIQRIIVKRNKYDVGHTRSEKKHKVIYTVILVVVSVVYALLFWAGWEIIASFYDIPGDKVSGCVIGSIRGGDGQPCTPGR